MSSLLLRKPQSEGMGDSDFRSLGRESRGRALGAGRRNKDYQCSNLNRVLSPLGTPGSVNMIILSTRSVIRVMGLVTTTWLRECYISGKGE